MSAKTNSPQVKKFMIDLLIFEDKLDSNGNRMRRSSFPKNHFRGAFSLKKKIIENHMELAEIKKSKEPQEIKWVKQPDFKQEDRMSNVLERYTEDEIELDDKEIKALRFFYDDRDEITSVDIESLDEFEKIVGIIKVS